MDTLIGGLGQDKMTGGGEADEFRFAGRTNRDWITDFQIGVDTIAIKSEGINNFDELVIQQRATGDTVIFLDGITGAGTDRLILVGIDADQLSADDFSFFA